MGGGGGLVQLVAHGVQNTVLSGNPQITFFKTVYRRSTNYAMESIKQKIINDPLMNTGTGIDILRNGDLLKNIWFEYSPRDFCSQFVNIAKAYPEDAFHVLAQTNAANFGNGIIDIIDLIIGGQVISKIYGKWLTIWQYLSEKNHLGIQGMPGYWGGEPGIYNTASYQDPNVCTKSQLLSYNHRATILVSNIRILQTNPPEAPNKAWIKIPFWFCNNPGLALPLIALQYTTIQLRITFNNIRGISIKSEEFTELSNMAIWCDYIFLDKTERQLFAENNHEYLMEQVQLNENILGNNIELNFSQPVKELIWATSPVLLVSDNTPNFKYVINESTIYPPLPLYFPIYGLASPYGSPSNTFSGISSPVYSLNDGDYTVVLNGRDHTSIRDISYYTRVHPWERHNGYGSVLLPNSVGVYSFALRPDEFQPSGSLNIGIIDTKKLSRTNPDAATERIDIYAVGYNILRIVGGQAGLAYGVPLF